MVQYTLQSRVLKGIFWTNFALTMVATVYFGWHYLADDIAGVMIAFISFYLGGIASGQKFRSAACVRIRRPRHRSSRGPPD